MSWELWALVVAVLLLPVTAFFAAAQSAFSRVTVSWAERLVEEGAPGADRVMALLERGPGTLSALALLKIVPMVTAVALVGVATAELLVPGAAIAVTAVVGVAVLFVVGEVIPRNLALSRADVVARRVSRVAGVLTRALSPVSGLLVWIGRKLTPGPDTADGPFVTEDAIRDLIDAAEGEVIEPTERQMLHGVFELSDTLVREIMVPRPDMVMVSSEDPLSRVVEIILDRGFSRIPVFAGEDRDDIIGLLYAKDILGRLHRGGTEGGPWEDLIRPPYVVPELKSVDGLLRELQAQQVHMAIVVDEYGAVVGLVTIEDILEEIVGEIVDEYDLEEELVEDLGEERWRVDARLPIDDLDELVDTSLPDEEWDTVGGLLFGMLGHVPRPGEAVEVDGLRLVAERVRGRRIAKVLVERSPGPTRPAAEALGER